MDADNLRKKPNRNPPTSNRELLIIFGLFVGFIAIVFWLLWWAIGLLVNALVWYIPIGVEQQLGAAIVPIYEQQALPSRAQATLNQLLDRLETNLPPEQHRDRDYRVLFVPQKIVNALALPGDTIVIYQGLVAQAESENELMMVLGHELGHFANRDHLRGLGQALVLRLAIASIFGDVGGLQAVLVSGAEAFSRSQYSQSQELQADEFGIDLLQATYGHVAGATDFFARLDRKRGANIAFLSTHPAPGNRVAQLQRIIEERRYPVRERSPLPPSLQRVWSKPVDRSWALPVGGSPKPLLKDTVGELRYLDDRPRQMLKNM